YFRHYPSMLRRRAPSGRPRGWASESVWDLRGGAAMNEQGVSRRELFRWGGVLALPALLRAKGAEAAAATAAATTGLRVGPAIYQSIGVRPLVNARGTYTILSGPLLLPQARAAVDAAARHYLHPG